MSGLISESWNDAKLELNYRRIDIIMRRIH